MFKKSPYLCTSYYGNKQPLKERLMNGVTYKLVS